MFAKSHFKGKNSGQSGEHLSPLQQQEALNRKIIKSRPISKITREKSGESVA
jgi:hypothetical protein